MRGKFITFEGIDGSGKTTALGHVARRLRDLGIPHVVTREPGATPLGRAIRELVLREPMLPVTELFLYAADRAEHIHQVIRPALEAGHIVLSDRYADATLAYQGYGRGLDLERVRDIIRLATGGLVPDLTILLDVDVQEAWRRLGRTRSAWADRFEHEGKEFLERVRQGYLAIARQYPERIRIITSSGSADETASLVWEAVRPVLFG